MRPMHGRTVLTALLLTASFAACGGNNDVVKTVTVEISGDSRTVAYEAEVASTPSERQRGLMERESLPANRGMLFLFPQDNATGFWMKNTLIPLDIAFIDDGRIVELRSMTPCTTPTCPLTTPSRFYDTALEVNEGSFDRRGVTVGERIRVSGTLPKVS